VCIPAIGQQAIAQTLGQAAAPRKGSCGRPARCADIEKLMVITVPPISGAQMANQVSTPF
jgi:hypothetical protein